MNVKYVSSFLEWMIASVLSMLYSARTSTFCQKILCFRESEPSGRHFLFKLMYETKKLCRLEIKSIVEVSYTLK